MKVIRLDVKKDERGSLVEVFKPEYIGKNEMRGQFFVSTAKVGATKGHHYHTRKTEWFCVIRGTGTLHLEHIETGEKRTVIMGESNMVTVEITPQFYHYLENAGTGEMILLVYSSEPFNPDDPDTFSREQRPEGGATS